MTRSTNPLIIIIVIIVVPYKIWSRGKASVEGVEDEEAEAFNI